MVFTTTTLLATENTALPFLTAQHPQLSLNVNSHYIVDSSGLSIDSIARISNKFWQALPKLPYNGGYNPYTILIRLQYVVDVGQHRPWIIVFDHALLDTVTVFSVHNSTLQPYAQVGWHSNKSWPALADYKPAFVAPAAAETNTVIIKIKTSDVCALSLEAVELDCYVRRNNSASLGYGLYFGAMLLLIVFNAFLFFFARLRSCLWYVFYVGGYVLYQSITCGIINPGNSPLFLARIGTPLFIGLCIIAGSGFSIEFLGLSDKKYRSRVLLIFFIVFMALGAALIVLSPFEFGRTAAIAASIIAPLFLVFCPVCGAFRINATGRAGVFYVIASTVLLLGIAVNALRNFGLIPNVFFTAHGTIVGSIIEFIIIALALVDRIAVIQNERAMAQQKAEVAERVSIQSRLQALQAQIKPHFLFNTLNMLAETVVQSPKKAESLIINLALFFRFSLTASLLNTVPLSKELEIVDRYLMIEQERFGSRLNYTITTDGNADTALVPGFLI